MATLNEAPLTLNVFGMRGSRFQPQLEQASPVSLLMGLSYYSLTKRN